MIDKSIIFKIIGSLLFIEALLLLACLFMAIGYQEDDVPAFIITIILTTRESCCIILGAMQTIT